MSNSVKINYINNVVNDILYLIMNPDDTSVGYLKLFLGCMFSKKTTSLMDIYHFYKNDGRKVCVINHACDIRFPINTLTTHDTKTIPCISMTKLQDLYSNQNELINTSEIFLINEGQFFSDLYRVVKSLVVTYNKIVYVCGLDGDSNMNKFGTILDLIPIADSYIKLHAMCAICDNHASFTKRIDNKSTAKIYIGGKNEYMPVCRKCYK
jgi:thymidine kinase